MENALTMLNVQLYNDAPVCSDFVVSCDLNEFAQKSMISDNIWHLITQLQKNVYIAL